MSMLFFDVEAITSMPEWQKLHNVFASSPATFFRTSRGHLAIGIDRDVFEKLGQRRAKLVLMDDTIDGLRVAMISGGGA